jgi:vacuolar protein sorting-associated protein 13A/C
LKNKDGVKMAIFGVADFELMQFSLESESRLSLSSMIKLDYFNKRKLDFEPMVEPWKFLIKMKSQTNELKEV